MLLFDAFGCRKSTRMVGGKRLEKIHKKGKERKQKLEMKKIRE